MPDWKELLKVGKDFWNRKIKDIIGNPWNPGVPARQQVMFIS